MTVRKIAVVGAGTMGSGIARAAAGSGFYVTLLDRDESLAAMGLSKIRNGLARKVSSGELDSRERDDMLSRLKTSGTLEDCADADLVIEAAAEQEPIKRQIFKTLDQICPTGTIFSTNTSSISVTRLASVTNRPDRFIGMHFMNPAYVMKLVEIVTGLRTSTETVAAIEAVAGKMGKTAVVVGDSPGFVANRILMPMINDAICCLHEGTLHRSSHDIPVHVDRLSSFPTGSSSTMPHQFFPNTAGIEAGLF